MTTHSLARALLAGPDMEVLLRDGTGALHPLILHYDAAGTALAWLEADEVLELDLEPPEDRP